MNSPDFSYVTSIAYKELITNNCSKFPININRFKTEDGSYIIITSFKEYSKITGISIGDLTLDGKYNDGLAQRELRPGLNLIIYNSESYERRQRHTILHEVGHIKCHHQHHGDIEEVEAHFFASQVLMPNVIIKELMHRNIKITKEFLMDFFMVSNDAAQKRLDYLRRYPETHKNMYDDIILNQFHDYINICFPKNQNIFIEEYDDYMVHERMRWS